MSYTPTRSIPPENITPAIALKKESILSEQKKQTVFTVQILSTACRVYQPNALPKRIVCLEDGRHVKSVYSKARCISSEKNKHFYFCFMKVSRKTNERERDETSFRYDLRSLRSRVDCALFSNPLDLLSQIKNTLLASLLFSHSEKVQNYISQGRVSEGYLE